jgi:nitroreductase
MLEKPADTDRPLLPALKARWSSRAFSDTLLTDDELRDCFEAARWAPSAGNGQPWRFIVAPRDDAAAFAAALQCLHEANALWARHAAALIVSVAQTVRDDGQSHRTALYDLGQAVAHLTVQATALGLTLRQMAGFSAELARETFAIPQGFEPVTMVAIGRRGDPAGLPETLQAREHEPRRRHPAAQWVFVGRWGQAAWHTPAGDGE